MNTPHELIIHIDWPFFLTIFGLATLLAWRANGRFTKIETSIEWLKETVRDLKVAIERIENKAR